MQLQGDAAAPARARAQVLAVLTGELQEDHLDVVVLLISELVTNAVLHAASPVTLRGWLEPARLRVEVTDDSPIPPALRTYGPESTTGRGLRMVAHLSAGWGISSAEDGKTVWFELDISAGPSTAAPAAIFDINAAELLE